MIGASGPKVHDRTPEPSNRRAILISCSGCASIVATLVLLCYAAYGLYSGYRSVPFRGVGATILRYEDIRSASGRIFRVKYAISDSDCAELADRAVAVPELSVIICEDASILTEAGISQIARIRQLSGLSLERAHRLGDSAITVLATMPRLRYVRCSDSPVLTDAGLSRLSGMQLTEIGVSNTAISDQGVASLANMRSLTTLDIAGCENVGGSAMDSLVTASRLSSLNIARCNRIDSPSIVRLLQMTSLHALTLDDLRLSDSVLLEAEKSQSLTYLSLRNASGFSESVVARLRATRPGLVVER